MGLWEWISTMTKKTDPSRDATDAAPPASKTAPAPSAAPLPTTSDATAPSPSAKSAEDRLIRAVRRVEHVLTTTQQRIGGLEASMNQVQANIAPLGRSFAAGLERVTSQVSVQIEELEGGLRSSLQDQIVRDMVDGHLARVIDETDIVLGHTNAGAQDLAAAVDGIRTRLLDALCALGVEVIPTRKGDLFDENQHEASDTSLHLMSEGSLRIAQVLRRGYTIHGRLLRRTLVRTTRGE